MFKGQISHNTAKLVNLKYYLVKVIFIMHLASQQKINRVKQCKHTRANK